VGEEAVRPVSVPEDVHEHEVDERQQHRVEHEPELAERRVEVLRLELRARQLEGELAPPPQLAHVRPDRRQADAVRFVDVGVEVPFELALVLGVTRGDDRLRGARLVRACLDLGAHGWFRG
jgi:hypothetical protein